MRDNTPVGSHFEDLYGGFGVHLLPVSSRPRVREVPSLPSWVCCFLTYLAIFIADQATRERATYGLLIVREAMQHGGQGWLDSTQNCRQRLSLVSMRPEVPFVHYVRSVTTMQPNVCWHNFNHQLSGLPLQISAVIINPLGTDIVCKLWGKTATQLQSGFSLVIKVEAEGKVYKYPFNDLETCQVLSLMQFLKDLKGPHPTRCSMPLERSVYLLRDFFSYPDYGSPMSRAEARQRIVFFVDEVIMCVKKLHSLGLAHMDIRLENVCFTASRNAVLDRYVPLQKLAIKLPYNSKSSTMYQSPFRGSTAEHLDWKQVSIMMCYIQSTKRLPYHSITIIL